MFDRGDPCTDLTDHGPAVDSLPIVEISIACNEDNWLDLSEAVEYTVHTEIGRAGRPDRAHAGCCQHPDDGLSNIRHERRDTITLSDALR